VVAALGLGNVEVVAGDVDELETATLHGPFDLALTRLFLLYQADPAQTLRRIAGLLRPGGWVIALEPLRSPPPRSFPHLDALDAYWELLHELVEGFGAPPQAVEHLPRSAAAAGLEVVRMGGFFNVDPPDLAFPIHAGTLAAARERATAAGLVTGQQIDQLVGDLRAAGSGSYEWVSSPFFLDLTLRKADDRISETVQAPDHVEGGGQC
jgi:SAM-dependent methyltransferase